MVIVACTRNLSIWEVPSRGYEAEGQPRLPVKSCQRRGRESYILIMPTEISLGIRSFEEKFTSGEEKGFLPLGCWQFNIMRI